MLVPPLKTDRLLIRPFTMEDLDAAHQLLDVDLAETGTDVTAALEDRQRWLQWTVLSYDELARLHQPPYGDRAVVLTGTGRIIGACGFAPCLNAFGQLPAFGGRDAASARGLASQEVGLYWAIAPAYQRQGYATEAARALIDYAFDGLHLARIVATTEYANTASVGVMRKVGMTIEHNPYPDPPWLQVTGILYHPRLRDAAGRHTETAP